jgi:hypothetical protein
MVLENPSAARGRVFILNASNEKLSTVSAAACSMLWRREEFSWVWGVMEGNRERTVGGNRLMAMRIPLIILVSDVTEFDEAFANVVILPWYEPCP